MCDLGIRYKSACEYIEDSNQPASTQYDQSKFSACRKVGLLATYRAPVKD